MRQDLWLVNSGLVIIFAATMGLYELTIQEIPLFKAQKKLMALVDEKSSKQNASASHSWEKIYQDDLFGTYVQQEIKPVKQSLTTPIPEPREATIPAAPELKKQEFIAPLTITLKGVITGNDEMRNVAMINDETDKEGLYHLGEKIKDAQIIKIAHNRVVVLRANGQQETYYLRKDDTPEEAPPADKWKYIARKVNDQTIDIDPQGFTAEVESLGTFIKNAAIVGTTYAAGNPIGIRVGNVQGNPLAENLGLASNDILKSINNLSLADEAQRIKAYETLIATPLGGKITAVINRANKDITVTYNLVNIPKPRKSSIPGIRYATDKPTPEEQLKQSRTQQRETNIREFNKQHFNPQKNNDAMLEIRRRILAGLQQRLAQNKR